MVSKLRTHASLVVAFVALFFAIGGSSFAADAVDSAAKLVTGKNVKNSSLTGKDVKNSSLTASDVKDRSLLAADFKSGQLPAGPAGSAGPKGETGSRGPQGQTGEAGTPATKLWAVVNADGSLARGSGATSSTFNGAYYRVAFNQPVDTCSYQATIGKTGAGFSNGGEAEADEFVGNGFPASEVLVDTYTSAGAAAQKKFSLAVFC